MGRTALIRKLVDKYEIAAKIGFGQNFLVDDLIIQKIEDSIFSFGSDTIAEIGCGLGSLTFGLVSRETKVIGYEIDRDMLKVLRNEITVPNFELHEEDFLKTDLKYLEDNKALITGNLPYNLTKRILEKIISYPYPFSFGFMVQKEVAEKLIYQVGKKTNSALGAYLFLNGEVNLVTIVPSTSFLPAPKVTSAFITYKAKTANPNYYPALKKMYMAENKTLAGFLSKTSNINRADIENVLESPTKRIHELNKDELLKVINLFN